MSYKTFMATALISTMLVIQPALAATEGMAKKRMDKNADGVISEVEAKEAKEKRHQMKKERHEKMMKEMDTDGDGSISKEEHDAAGQKHFEKLDKNKDGKISPDERIKWRGRKKAE